MLHTKPINRILIFALVTVICLVFSPLGSLAMAMSSDPDNELAADVDHVDEEESESEPPDDGEPETGDQPDESEDNSEPDDNGEEPEPDGGDIIPEQPTDESGDTEEAGEGDENQPDEAGGGELTGAEEIVPQAEIFATADDVAVVSNLAGLRTALTSPDITTVHLDADISLPAGGIEINPAKPYLIIDGTNPYGGDGLTVHTLTEYNSYYYYDAIRLEKNGALKSIKLQNINVTGKNFYGIVCVYDVVMDVTQIFENFTYRGPQPVYNRYGTAHFINSTVIRGYGYLDCVGEVAEAANVILEGDVYLEDTKTAYYEYSAFWLEFKQGGVSDGNITIKPYARVTCIVRSSGSYFTLPSAIVNARLIIGEGAAFEYSGVERFWYLYPFKGITIEDGAQMYVNLSGGNTVNATVRVNGNLEAGSNSVFHVISTADSTYPALTVSGGSATFNNPKSVVLSRRNGRPLQYGTDGRLNITAQQINYWSTFGSGSETPRYSWRKADGGNLEFSALVEDGSTGGITGAIESNYKSPDDYTGLAAQNADLSAAVFRLADARTIAFGSLPLTAESIYSGGYSHIQGMTDPGATVEAQKKGPGESSYSFMDRTIAGDGAFDFVSQENLKDTSIKIKSYVPYLVSQKEFLVSAPILTVTFQTPRGTAPQSQQVEWGGSVTRPPNPVDPDSEMDFYGWYRDEALIVLWDFDADIVTTDLTLYAKWSPKPRYTVTTNHIRISTGEPVELAGKDLHNAQAVVTPNIADMPGYRAAYYTIGQDDDEYDAESPFTVNGDMEITIYYISTVIEMEAPMQMLFAAFQSNGGEVTSSDYKIINHSDMPVQVRLRELQSDEGAMESLNLRLVPDAVQDGDLRLDLMAGGGFTRSIAGILPNTGLDELGYLGTLGGFGQNDRQGELAIGGKYAGPFHIDYKQPRVSFVFQFQLAV